MKTKEEKLIALKVMLSVQDVSEMSAQTKIFKTNKISVSDYKNSNSNLADLVIRTHFVKEMSWLLFQFKYVFQDHDEDFTILCEGLKRKEKESLSLRQTVEYLLKKSGKLLG